MKTVFLKSDLILLLAAIIWGFAFVAQRVGMDYVGPFTYNGVRFALGTVVLIPFLWLRASKGQPLIMAENRRDRSKLLIGSVMTGLFLFGGAALQQLGLQQTTAGKAGFITGLYVVFVPIVGLFFGQRSNLFLWIGAILSVAGLYLLSMTGGFAISPGDKLVLYCAIFFTFHVLFIAWLSPLMDSFLLAVIQFSICALLNMIIAFAIEPVNLESILQAWLPIAYGGIISVGIAYTLQVIAQRTAHPAYASIILSLEAVFAVFGGWLLLNEIITLRMALGCGLMLAGMIIVQRHPDESHLKNSDD
ncbi:MAG: DMT family transporter [Bacteroidetes bacterium]|nr:DMT family transporter [Bacteroidota bacterium]